MREICGEFFIFQQGKVPAHWACETINLLKRDTCIHFTKPLPPNSTDLKPVHYKNMRINETAGIASSWCRWTEAAINRCLASLRWLTWSVAQMSLPKDLCEMMTFWAFNLTPLTHMLFCVSCLLILWTLSKCDCVKCSRISWILVSYVLQGSVATHLRCDGQCDMSFVANFSENTSVKEFWKSVIICLKL